MRGIYHADTHTFLHIKCQTTVCDNPLLKRHSFRVTMVLHDMWMSELSDDNIWVIIIFLPQLILLH